MKKLILLVFLLTIVTVTAYAQSYIGYATSQVNFRSDATTNSSVIRSLPKGSTLFIVSLSTHDGFYNAIDVETNKEGYIHSSYVRVGQMLPKNTEGIFTPSGTSSSVNPEIKIRNNTSKTLTLKMGNNTYSFSPQESRSITVPSGKYEYRASAPGVIPDYGAEVLSSSMSYEWEFYISSY
ncbi:SH3 domain-containing protein [Pontibacter sp. MBLB2868]|uniref:SH3 domain-containing protein n=1 Tax=Pontibacter sp. MBLB2868 TaxID=3451555 RepID=UPI003F7565D3